MRWRYTYPEGGNGSWKEGKPTQAHLLATVPTDYGIEMDEEDE